MFSFLDRICKKFGFRNEVPFCSSNTFFVWEPCTYSHAEVVPGFVKYLADMGFDVSVFVAPDRYKEGLFSKFDNTNGKIHYNKLPQKSVKKYFEKNGLGNARGIILTTSGKIANVADYESERNFFGKLKEGQKVLIVEHDVKKAVELGVSTKDIITLRKPYFKDAPFAVVNPHYFGNVNISPRNECYTNFITVGALRGKRRNSDMLIEAVTRLASKGRHDFKITVIGKGSVKNVPESLRKYFDVKGEASFDEMYSAMEDADFFLPLLDGDNPKHDRYITTGTSGSFQLIYGFAKPCIISKKFASVNSFNRQNSIIYSNNGLLESSMQKAMDMTSSDYKNMQNSLISMAQSIAEKSSKTLKELIYGK